MEPARAKRAAPGAYGIVFWNVAGISPSKYDWYITEKICWHWFFLYKDFTQSKFEYFCWCLVYRIQIKTFECLNYRQGQSALWMCACAWCITSQPNHILSGRFQDLESEAILLAHTLHSPYLLLARTHTHTLSCLLSLTHSLYLACSHPLSLLLAHTHSLSVSLALACSLLNHSLFLAHTDTHSLLLAHTHIFSLSPHTHTLSLLLALLHTLLLAHTHATCDNATSRSCARAMDVKKLNHTPTILTPPRLITHAHNSNYAFLLTQAGFCEGFHSPAYSVDFGRFTVDAFQQFDEDGRH